MARRILTKQDVLAHASYGRIEVGPDDIVTPAALEAARRAAVEIVQGAGAPVLPGAALLEAGTRAPGPALARLAAAARSSPPPGAGEDGENEVILTCVGRNRPGVLAEITARVAASHGNILNISQRIVENYFFAILVIDASGLVTDFNTFKTDLEGLSSEGDYRLAVQHGRVFQAMHRI
jgi:ACT domain-containing protein